MENKIKIRDYLRHEDTIVVYSKKFTRDILNQIIKNEKDFKTIKLSKLVSEIGEGTFENVDFSNNYFMDFSSSDIKSIGCAAFHNCKDIYFGEYFKNVTKVGKYAFYNAHTKSKTNIFLPNLKVVPNGCFINAEIDFLDVGKVEDVGIDAFKDLKVTAINLSPDIYDYYMSLNQEECNKE